MTDVQALHTEVTGLLDALRDKAQQALDGLSIEEAWSGLCRHEQQHARWAAAVLLLVGDDGLLRKQAARFHNLTQSARSYEQHRGETWLSELRDTLQAMGADQ